MNTTEAPSWLTRQLNRLEWLGNKLPDPAVLFIVALLGTWGLSAYLDGTTFEVPGKTEPAKIESLLTGKAVAGFLTGMVKQFTDFHPLGVVLVAMLGVGIAEHSGFINCCLKSLLIITPRFLLTPMLIAVALISHTAADAGYVLVIPIGGVMFYAAGRHPLAGIAAAFAGVSGGFSANVVVSGIDPLLAGITQEATSVIAKQQINPLCNFYFTASSSLLIILLGWFVTDWIIEPKLRGTMVDAEKKDLPEMTSLTWRDVVAMIGGLTGMLACIVGLYFWAKPADSVLRGPTGSLTANAPLMQAIVPLIFFLFAIPGLIHGYVSGNFKGHRDVVRSMSKAMETMGYYLVLVFFAAIFIAAFNNSKIGLWLAVSGAGLLRDLGASKFVVVVGVILMTSLVNLLIGSASAKWAMLSPILVPMLMMLGISPEFTQAAYRVGDSTTNIITPMMPYFPLVVVFCQKYVKSTGIGTLGALMLPYSVCFFIGWTMYLLVYWQLGIPLGPSVSYEYSAAAV